MAVHNFTEQARANLVQEYQEHLSKAYKEVRDALYANQTSNVEKVAILSLLQFELNRTMQNVIDEAG